MLGSTPPRLGGGTAGETGSFTMPAVRDYAVKCFAARPLPPEQCEFPRSLGETRAVAVPEAQKFAQCHQLTARLAYP